MSAAVTMAGAAGGGVADGGMAAVPPDTNGSGLGEGALAAIASAIFAFLVLGALLAAFIVVRRRRQRQAAAADVFAKITQYGPDTTASFMTSGRMPFFDPQTAVRTLLHSMLRAVLHAVLRAPAVLCPVCALRCCSSNQKPNPGKHEFSICDLHETVL